MTQPSKVACKQKEKGCYDACIQGHREKGKGTTCIPSYDKRGQGHKKGMGRLDIASRDAQEKGQEKGRMGCSQLRRNGWLLLSAVDCLWRAKMAACSSSIKAVRSQLTSALRILRPLWTSLLLGTNA